jgi:tRNA(fMet)-specific endonuclease VapC
VLVLDTDHLTAYGYRSEASQRLTTRLRATEHEVATTAVSCEEQMKGVLAAINRQRDPLRQIVAYEEFVNRLEFLAGFTVLPWDEDSAKIFLRLRRLRVRCGTMDLKIAAIALAHEATLLTRNTVDLAHVPGLRQENWLD